MFVRVFRHSDCFMFQYVFFGVVKSFRLPNSHAFTHKKTSPTPHSHSSPSQFLSLLYRCTRSYNFLWFRDTDNHDFTITRQGAHIYQKQYEQFSGITIPRNPNRQK